MAEVGHWEEVRDRLGVPDSKLQEIEQQSSTEREKCLALGDYWVNTDPEASWEKLARKLYRWREERALAVMKQYLQQGMCTSKFDVDIPMDTQLLVKVIDDYRRTKTKATSLILQFPGSLVQALY